MKSCFIKVCQTSILLGLMVACGSPQAAPTRDLTLHTSIQDAVTDAINQAVANNRPTFYSVGVFRSEKDGRGAVLVTGRRQIPPHGDCLELAFSVMVGEKTTHCSTLILGDYFVKKRQAPGTKCAPICR